MSKPIHDPFDDVIKEYKFRQDRRNNLRWFMNDGVWDYILYFEGYAYVVYKKIYLYVRPIRWLLRVYNTFKKSHVQVKLTHEVPIAHFRDAERFRQCMDLLTDSLEDEQEEKLFY